MEHHSNQTSEKLRKEKPGKNKDSRGLLKTVESIETIITIP